MSPNAAPEPAASALSEGHAVSRGAALPILAALAVLALFWLLGLLYFAGYRLDLGSIHGPTPRYGQMLAVWNVLGSAAAALLALGLARLLTRGERLVRLRARIARAGSRRFLWLAASFVGLFALALDRALLRGRPLADDEHAYRFMAELLGSGRLSAPSPPMKAFFDNAFLINDGALYAKYSLGWPALLAPWSALGAPFLANPLYLALTLPPLYLWLAREHGPAWARAGVLLMLSSPMLLLGAATDLSHTSCTLALCCACLFTSRALDRAGDARTAAALALALGVAAFIRPSSTLGLGVPLLLAFFASLRRVPAPARLRSALAFAAPAMLFAAAFLTVNHLQTGDALQPAYLRLAEYEADNAHRFAATGEGFSHLSGGALRGLGTLGLGAVRLSQDLLGWPLGLLSVLLALGAPATRLPWAMLACYALVHLSAGDAGIDSFGPLHFYELALPLLALLVAGFRRAHGWLGALPATPIAAALAPATLLALVLTSWLGFVPVRMLGAARLAADVDLPLRVVERAGLANAIVFAPRPFAPSCHAHPGRAMVFFRPNNDPDLRAPVLWANHFDVVRDRELLAAFPGRVGYLLGHDGACAVELVPLDSPEAARVGKGAVVTPCRASDNLVISRLDRLGLRARWSA